MKFFVVSLKKLVIMNVCTFGLYGFYWNYRAWHACRVRGDAKVNPIVRSMFAPLFIYSLMGRVDEGIRRSGRYYAWSPIFVVFSMGVGFYCFLELWMSVRELQSADLRGLGRWKNLETNASIFFMSMALPLPLVGVVLLVSASIQSAINFLERDCQGKRNCRLSVTERTFAFLGGVVCAAYLLILLLSFVLWSITRDF